MNTDLEAVDQMTRDRRRWLCKVDDDSAFAYRAATTSSAAAITPCGHISRTDGCSRPGRAIRWRIRSAPSSTTRRAAQPSTTSPADPPLSPAPASVIALLLVAVACGTSERSVPPASTSTTRAPTTSSAVSPTTSSTIATPTSTTVTPTTVGRVTPAAVVRKGDVHRRRIALTFDAGSDTGNTAAILDLLATRHVRTSFSLTGDFARANAALVRRIEREGHVIVNHTDDHLSFTGASTHTAPLSPAERAAELQQADAAISDIAGATTRPWFRPPYGDIDAATPVERGAGGLPVRPVVDRRLARLAGDRAFDRRGPVPERRDAGRHRVAPCREPIDRRGCAPGDRRRLA